MLTEWRAFKFHSSKHCERGVWQTDKQGRASRHKMRGKNISARKNKGRTRTRKLTLFQREELWRPPEFCFSNVPSAEQGENSTEFSLLILISNQPLAKNCYIHRLRVLVLGSLCYPPTPKKEKKISWLSGRSGQAMANLARMGWKQALWHKNATYMCWVEDK